MHSATLSSATPTRSQNSRNLHARSRTSHRVPHARSQTAGVPLERDDASYERSANMRTSTKMENRCRKSVGLAAENEDLRRALLCFRHRDPLLLN